MGASDDNDNRVESANQNTTDESSAIRELQRYLLRLGFNTWIKPKKNLLSIKKKSSKHDNSGAAAAAVGGAGAGAAGIGAVGGDQSPARQP